MVFVYINLNEIFFDYINGFLYKFVNIDFGYEFKIVYINKFIGDLIYFILFIGDYV